MLRSDRWTVLVWLFSAGCTAPPVSAALEGEREIHGDRITYTVRPDAEPRKRLPGDEAPALEPVATASQAPAHPHLVVGRSANWAGIGGCQFHVEAIGFPALSPDAATIVTTFKTDDDNPDVDLTTMVVQWRNVDGTVQRTQAAYDGAAVGSRTEDGSDQPACTAAERAVRRELKEINAALGDTFIPMQRLPVFTESTADEAPAEIRELPGPERPVEATFHAESFVLRIPGIEVLHREAHPEWIEWFRRPDHTPNIEGVYGAPRAGIGVVRITYDTWDCMSTTYPQSHVIRLPPRVFEETRQRTHHVENDAN